MKKIIKCFLFLLMIIAIGCVSVGCTQINNKNDDVKQNKVYENENKVETEQKTLSYETYSWSSLSDFQESEIKIYENNSFEYESILYNKNETGYDKETLKGNIETDKNNCQYLVFNSSTSNKFYKNDLVFSKKNIDVKNYKYSIKKVGSSVVMFNKLFTKNGLKNKESFYISENNSIFQYDYFIKKDSLIDSQKINYIFYHPEKNGSNFNYKSFNLKSAKPAIDTTKTGIQTVELTNGNVKVEANICIYSKMLDKVPYILEVFQKNVKLGTSIDNLIQNIWFNVNFEDVRVTKNMISGYDSSKLGKQTIKLSYNGIIDEFEITIYEGKYANLNFINYGIEPLFIVKKNEKIDDLKRKIIEKEISLDYEKIKSIEKLEIENFESKKIGSQICTVKCCGLTKEISVFVVNSDENPIVKIDANDVTIKVDANSKISFEGKLEMIKLDGTIDTLEVTKELFKDLSIDISNKYDRTTLKITKDGATFYDIVQIVRNETENK